MASGPFSRLHTREDANTVAAARLAAGRPRLPFHCTGLLVFGPRAPCASSSGRLHTRTDAYAVAAESAAALFAAGRPCFPCRFTCILDSGPRVPCALRANAYISWRAPTPSPPTRSLPCSRIASPRPPGFPRGVPACILPPSLPPTAYPPARPFAWASACATYCIDFRGVVTLIHARACFATLIPLGRPELFPWLTTLGSSSAPCSDTLPTLAACTHGRPRHVPPLDGPDGHHEPYAA